MRSSDWSSDVCSSDLLLQCQPSPTSDPAYIASAPCRIVCEVFTVEPFGADSIAVLILMRDPENAPVEQRHVIAHAQHGLIDVPALELAVDAALQKLGGHLVGGGGIGETRLHHDSRRLCVDRWLQYLDARPAQVIAAIGEPDDAKRLAQVVAHRLDDVDPVAAIV